MNIPWSHRDGLDPDAPPPDDFPQRAWCFSSDWLDHGLARTLGLEAVAATVENVHYLPGRHLKVVYRLAPGHLPERVTLDFATPADTGPDDPAPAPAPAQPGRSGPGRWLPDIRARAWLWPDDPADLPVARWMSPTHLRRDMPRVVAQDLPATARLLPRVLTYAPGERLAVHWRPEAWSPDSSHGAGWVMKAQREGVADTRALHRLWRDRSRRWDMAEPLDDPQETSPDAADSVRWERFLPGERLEAVAARDGWTRVLQQAARALVALHRQALDGLDHLPRHEGALEHALLDRKVMRRFRSALPQLADRAQALSDRLGRAMPVPGSRPIALLHGDLHTGNLLCQPDGRIAFIDLDSLKLGDPAFDLALLSTRLMLVGLLDPSQGSALAEPLAAWPQTYIDAGGDPALLPSYGWHVATLLLSRQVKTCVRHHAPDMTRLANALLTQAEALCPRLPERPQTAC